MPKPARRAALLSAALSLALPAVAAAGTLTVDPSVGGTACAGARCPTIQSAVDAAVPGDRIEVLAGTYAESPVIGKAVNVRGAGAGEVKVTGGEGEHVFTLDAAGISLSALTIDVRPGGGSAVLVSAPEARLADLVAQRAAPSSGAAAVVAAAGDAAVDIADSFIVQGAGAGAPGISSEGTGGLQLTDTLVVSSTGPAITLTESAANRLVRSSLVSAANGADGLRFAAAASAADKKLVLDSSQVMAGPGGTALSVVTTGSAAGDVVVDGRHVTAVGRRGAVLDASQAQGTRLDGPSGGITATFASSIVHGASTAQRFEPTLSLVQEANAVELAFSDSDAPPADGNGTVRMGNASNSPLDALFAPRSLRLRADAPVIDRGGAPAAGQSDTDVQGEPRVTGAASDIGADEFVNQAPVAKFGVANPSAGVGQDVGFISGSTDPEQDAGGGIVEYRWDFGDGTKETTSGLGVVHRYARPGVYPVTLQVVDRQGATSAVSPAQSVTIGAVAPTTGPALKIASPVRNRRLKLSRSGGRPPRPLVVRGSWADPEGIDSIQVALRLVEREAAGRRSARRSASPACTFFSGRHMVRRSCDRPVWIAAKVRGSRFEMRTRRGVRLPPGLYQLSVRGSDRKGNASAPPSPKTRSLVVFRVG